MDRNATRDKNEKFKGRLVGVYKGKLPDADNLSADDIQCEGCLSDNVFGFCKVCSIKDCTKSKGYSVSGEVLSACLTSKKLKLKPKESNIAGLQIVDLLAHPCCVGLRSDYLNLSVPNNFGGRIYNLLKKNKLEI